MSPYLSNTPRGEVRALACLRGVQLTHVRFYMRDHVLQLAYVSGNLWGRWISISVCDPATVSDPDSAHGAQGPKLQLGHPLASTVRPASA